MSDESRSGEFKLPPELSDLEHSLRELPLPSKSLDTVLDRDELMFQSGWAAALASENESSVASAPVTRWSWPVLTGTFATLSAVLAIALFSPAGSEGDSTLVAINTEKLVERSIDTEEEVSYPSLVESPSREDEESETPDLFIQLLKLKPARDSMLTRSRLLRSVDANDYGRLLSRPSERSDSVVLPPPTPLKARGFVQRKHAKLSFF